MSFILLEVTAEDIAYAFPANSLACPYANALLRQTGRVWRVRCDDGVRLAGAVCGRDALRLSARSAARIRRYDLTGEMEPHRARLVR